MKKILIIIQRANGDVFLASPTIDALHEKYPEAKIDLLINDDTLGIAKTLRHINHIHLYRYSWRKEGIFHRLIQELKLLKTIWRKYDLAISLTGSDRSIFFAIAAAKLSMGPVEKELKKSWWKRRLLSRAYVLNANEHIILNNVKPLRFLHALPPAIELKANVDPWARERMKAKLLEQAVTEFILFHPTAQYEYKVYPKHLRNQLFERLNSLGIPIVVTGANSALDQQISTELPALPMLHNWIGKTSLPEWIALMDLAEAYIGMDTLNMHIAAGLNKPIFAIFGPTLPALWSPWSNVLKGATNRVAPVQQYGNVTLFQANLACVACGQKGCNDSGRSECLFQISPEAIFEKVEKWFKGRAIPVTEQSA